MNKNEGSKVRIINKNNVVDKVRKVEAKQSVEEKPLGVDGLDNKVINKVKEDTVRETTFDNLFHTTINNVFQAHGLHYEMVATNNTEDEALYLLKNIYGEFIGDVFGSNSKESVIDYFNEAVESKEILSKWDIVLDTLSANLIKEHVLHYRNVIAKMEDSFSIIDVINLKDYVRTALNDLQQLTSLLSEILDTLKVSEINEKVVNEHLGYHYIITQLSVLEIQHLRVLKEYLNNTSPILDTTNTRDNIYYNKKLDVLVSTVNMHYNLLVDIIENSTTLSQATYYFNYVQSNS